MWWIAFIAYLLIAAMTMIVVLALCKSAGKAVLVERSALGDKYNCDGVVVINNLPGENE